MRVLLGVLLPLAAAQSCPPIVGNCYVFPPDDEWNRPIDTDPVDYQSSCVMPGVVALTSNLRLDVGTSFDQPYGMQYNVYTTTPANSNIVYGTDGENYQDESEWYDRTTGAPRNGNSPTPYSPARIPFPQNAKVEGQSTSGDPAGGDRHVIVLDAQNCMLYESWNSVRQAAGWQVSNTAVWNLTLGNKQRTEGWTSADAAGLAIYPGVLKYSEIAAAIADGSMVLKHALRFTSPTAQKAYANPGRHYGTTNDVTRPWYGARFRLKSSFSTTGYAQDTTVLINTLKKYGLIYADQGSGPWLTCDNDPGYDATLIDQINSGSKRIAWSNFELVQSIEPIKRGWTPASTACGAKTQNDDPNWRPTWNPQCPKPGSPPTPTTSSPPSNAPTSAPPTSAPPTLVPTIRPTRTPTSGTTVRPTTGSTVRPTQGSSSRSPTDASAAPTSSASSSAQPTVSQPPTDAPSTAGTPTTAAPPTSPTPVGQTRSPTPATTIGAGDRVGVAWVLLGALAIAALLL